MNSDPNAPVTPGREPDDVPQADALREALDRLHAAIASIDPNQIIHQITAGKRCREALQEAQATLEDRVRDRTAELTRLVTQLEQEMAERKRAEAALKKEEDLLRHMLAMQDRDRKLLAYEIHDGLAQQMAGALYMLQGFRERVATEPNEAWRTFDDGLHMLAQGITDVRRLIGGLRPPVLDESGVVAALTNLVYEVQSPDGPKIDFSADVQFDRLEPALENAIFRIVQECLTNACRYSKSERAVVRLTQREQRITIEVRDWGIGFDPDSVGGLHFGLRGIRERVRLLGGRAAIRSAPSRGTRIRVELPLVAPVFDPGPAGEPPPKPA